jgi:hypothetical protein
MANTTFYTASIDGCSHSIDSSTEYYTCAVVAHHVIAWCTSHDEAVKLLRPAKRDFEFAEISPVTAVPAMEDD